MNNKCFAHHLGRYTIVTEKKRVFEWSFPGDATLEENKEMLAYLEEELVKAIADLAKTIKDKEKSANEEIKSKLESDPNQ